MPKISALPPLATLADDDIPPIVDDSTTTTSKFTLSALREYLNTFIKPSDLIPFDYVLSGAVWSGDSYGSTRAASMTAAVIYIGGRRHTVSAVTARLFTASRDTYVDAVSNGDGTATLVYTEVTNNAASPALAASSIRIAIIITGASNIANAGSVNQGEESKVLPIASSVAYSVTDSLGNLICNRSPDNKLLGYRQITTNFATGSSSAVQVTGLSMPIIVPTGRKVELRFYIWAVTHSSTGISTPEIWDGAVGGTALESWNAGDQTASNHSGVNIERIITLSAGLHTINASLLEAIGGTSTLSASSVRPSYLSAKLI